MKAIIRFLLPATLSLLSLPAPAVEVAWHIPVDNALRDYSSANPFYCLSLTSDQGGGVIVDLWSDENDIAHRTLIWLGPNGTVRWRGQEMGKELEIMKCTPRELIYVTAIRQEQPEDPEAPPLPDLYFLNTVTFGAGDTPTLTVQSMPQTEMNQRRFHELDAHVLLSLIHI